MPHPATTAITQGHDKTRHQGAVNVPPYRASTIRFNSVEDYYTADDKPYPAVIYGAYGTPTTNALEQTIAALEGAHRCFATSSGMAAISTALLAFLQSGDHLLIADHAYGPARQFADTILTKFGVEVEYYDPLIGAGITAHIKPNTRVIYAESPGSLTFEVQDIPALATAAHKAGAILIADGTWASPLLWKPFDLGVDVVVTSATKYIGGHSDLLMGIISCTQQHEERLIQAFRLNGACSNGEDAFLALRGLRTLPLRLKAHEEAALTVAHWLKSRPEVDLILHPAFPDCPGHENWKRDYLGSHGLFSFLLKNHYPKTALAHMLEPMQLFDMGYSWGGYESLIVPFHPKNIRTARPWTHQGTAIRLHIGLEDTNDLIADLEAALGRLSA